MLIEFSVANFRSIKDEARLSLAANAATERRATNVMIPELPGEVRAMPLVRAAAIYGANAAGKTNLIRALSAMRTVVRQSGQDQDALPLTPFKFRAQSGDEPTTFDVMGIAQGVRFQYGFAATREAVRREWLYAWPRGRAAAYSAGLNATDARGNWGTSCRVIGKSGSALRAPTPCFCRQPRP